MFQTTNEITPSFLEENFKSLYDSEGLTRQNSRPSASSSLCPRQIALTINVPPAYAPILPCLNDYARIGNTIEDGVLAKYRKRNQLYLSQWKMPASITELGLDVGGIIDAFLKINGEIILMDVKSVGVVDAKPYINLMPDEITALNSGQAITFTSEDDRIKETADKGVKDSHVAQLQLYAAMTGFDKVFIQLMSRRVQDGYTIDGSPSVKFEQIPTDDHLLVRRVAVVLYAQECLKQGYNPDKLHGIKKGTCNDAFCQFQDYCWKDAAIHTTLKAITPEISAAFKTEALEVAKAYIAHRPQRKEMVLELLEKERNKRIKEKKDL
jgi:hypothetical protein